MTAPESDTNDSIWKSDAAVKTWIAAGDEREAKRAAQWRLMGELLPFAADEEFTVLDLGAGTGAASRAILALYPRAQAVLAEYSPQMIEEGTQIMEPFEGRFSYVEFDMTSSNWPDGIPAFVDAAVTSQCVHHIPDDRKQGLFTEIYGRLRPGGWYLNFDPVKSDDPEIEAAWDRANERQDPEAAEKARHRDEAEHARWENHVRYMIPLDRQLGFLAAAGFAAIDVYWKHLDYVIYGGNRPK